ncbi:TPA: DUF551 domain-containing protein [Klebsiella pneumoniae]
MTKSTITREQLEEWVAQLDEDGGCDATDRQLEALIRHSLAAMDSEPVAYTDERNLGYIDRGRETAYLWGKQNSEASDVALYRHAQPAPVVPEEKPIPNTLSMYAVDAVAAIAEVKGWNACCAAMLQELKKSAGTEAICRSDENVQVLHAGNSPAQSPIDHGYLPECECSGCKATARICAELAGNSQVIPDGYRLQPISEYEAMCAVVNSDEWPQRWIPVSERMPIEFEAVIAFDGDQVYGEAMYSSGDGFTIDGYDPCDRVQLQSVTHWMPLPAGPQEVK